MVWERENYVPGHATVSKGLALWRYCCKASWGRQYGILTASIALKFWSDEHFHCTTLIGCMAPSPTLSPLIILLTSQLFSQRTACCHGKTDAHHMACSSHILYQTSGFSLLEISFHWNRKNRSFHFSYKYCFIRAFWNVCIASSWYPLLHRNIYFDTLISQKAWIYSTALFTPP